MANTHKFKVKNGLTTPNISFKDSNLGAAITVTMIDSTDTLSFEGNAGQLFSITDSLGGTLFAVSDISGIPSLEIDDQGIVRIAEFNGYLVVGGDSATGTKGVTIQSGAISIRTDSAPGYVDFYCETNNLHRVRVKSPAHTDYSGNVDVTLPTSTGTLALTSQIPSTTGFITASSTNTLTNKTFDANGTGNNISNIDIGNMTSAVVVTESEGIGSNDNDTTLPTSAAVKDYVDNNAGGSGTGNTFSNHTSNATLAAFTTAVADTSGGAFTLTLPASPSTNDQVIIVDGKGTFGSNNLTVGRNGKNIQGSASNLILDVNNVTVRLNYNGTEWRVFTISNTSQGNAVTLTGAQTLTNKVIALGSNTISGTTAQFNTALTDDDFATLENSVTLTNKTLSNPSIKDYTENTVAIGNTGSTHTFNLSTGTFQTATLNANCTFTMPTVATGKSFVLKLTQGGSNTATFTNVKFAGGSAPTITTGSSKIDIISFISDGTNWYGNAIQDMS